MRSALFTVYVIGAMGMIFPFSRDLFILLTPFCILFSLLLIVFDFHSVGNNRFTFPLIVFYSIMFLVSFFVEMLGVNTGFPFGNYKYGDALGVKFFNTPLIIGLNWVMLVVASASLFSITKNVFLKSFFAALAMLVYDLVMEPVACKLNLWCWDKHIIPWQNYAAWFVIAFVFQISMHHFNFQLKSRIGKWVFVVQFVFFLLLLLYFDALKGR